MALSLDYEIGGEVHQDAYIRVEHISGSKNSGWFAYVYVFNSEKTYIIDTFTIEADYDPSERGYSSAYNHIALMFPDAVNA